MALQWGAVDLGTTADMNLAVEQHGVPCKHPTTNLECVKLAARRLGHKSSSETHVK
jgi:hypothetical protein